MPYRNLKLLRKKFKATAPKLKDVDKIKDVYWKVLIFRYKTLMFHFWFLMLTSYRNEMLLFSSLMFLYLIHKFIRLLLGSSFNLSKGYYWSCFSGNYRWEGTKIDFLSCFYSIVVYLNHVRLLLLKEQRFLMVIQLFLFCV